MSWPIPKLRGRFSRRGFFDAVSEGQVQSGNKEAYLGGLLGTRLSLRERSRSDLLTGFGRLSLRKEDISDMLKPKGLL